MLIFLLSLILLVIACCLARTSWETPTFKSVISFILIVTCSVSLIVCIIFFAFNTESAINKYEEYKIIDEKVAIYESLYNEKIEIVNEALNKYPMESEMYKKMNLSLLLKMPEIKSDILLKENIKIAIEAKNEIYKLRTKAIDIKKDLRIIRNYWFLVPSLYYPSVK